MAVKDIEVFDPNFSYEKKKKLTEYEVPEGFKVIGGNAFKGCVSLSSVKLPSSLVEIKYSAFEECTALTKLEIPEGVEYIGGSAFEDCTALEELKLPSTLKAIGLDVFKGCAKLRKIVLPDKIKNLTYSAFMGCSSLEEVVLPKNLTFIDNNVFTSCEKLKSIEIPSKITKLGYAMFAGCKSLEKVVLPKGLKKIPVAAFEGCAHLENIEIPKGVREIETAAFQGCTLLENVSLPKSIKTLSDRIFSDCVLLNNVEVPKGVKEVGGYAFYNCFSLKNIVLHDKIRSMGEFAFAGCGDIESVKLPKKLTTIERSTFYKCSSLKEIDLSNVKIIGESAFQGCESLESVVIPESVLSVGKHCFDGCGFNYIYMSKGSKNIVFSKSLPQDKELDKVIKFEDVQKCILDFDISLLAHEERLNEIIPLVEQLNRAKFTIPSVYFNEHIQSGKLEELKNKNFKFLGAELQDVRIRLVAQPNFYEGLAFMKFANALGCFSNEKILDKEGRETQAILAQKASSLFASIVKNENIPVGKFSSYFLNLPLDAKPNQDLLNFLSVKGTNKSLPNVDLLMRLEQDHKGLFVKVVTRFDEVKALRTLLDEHGKPYNLSWEQAIRKFTEINNYENVTEENRDIAQLFTEKRLGQDTFDKAAKLRDIAIKEEVPSHILGKPLKEESIIEKIERIKKQTDKTIIDAQQLIDELYEQKFTYEMLDKHDPKNAIIGLYASCCATITSGHYGKTIAESTMISHEVQNLVVKDSKGIIIAKGTMYVNSQKGYAVINDFEVNEKYRSHETAEPGYYSVGPEHKDEQDRELIFQTFKRGINAFVKEYDEQHPTKPIKKVTVGMGYNRLKAQCERYKMDTDYLRVPAEYNFYDSSEVQHILYARGVSESKLMAETDKGGKE